MELTQAVGSIAAQTADTLTLRLKGYAHPDLHAYLSEHDLQMTFSPAKKLYYSALRPLMPIPLRQRLQRKVVAGVNCRPGFIWPALVELLKCDQTLWRSYTQALYPDGHDCAVILTHDVETQAGFDFIPTLMELEEAYGLKSSWNLVPHKYILRQEVIDLIESKGHEIGIHGYNHDGTLYYSKTRFLRRAERINEALHRFHAVGFRSPQVHRNLQWLQHLDVLYDASCFDYDPYQPFPGGTACIWPFMAGKFVELPYTLPQDHTLFCALGQRDISVWLEKMDWLVENHGMILSITHPDYLMVDGRMRLYEAFLSRLKAVPNSWLCLPREMAQRYISL